MRKLRDESGAVLVLTLLVVVMLTITVTDFLFGTYVDYSIAASFRDDVTATTAARAGAQAGREIILQDLKDGGGTDHLGEQWAQTIPVPFGDNFAFVNIRDESGKLNLNYLVETTSDEPNQKLLAIFKRLLANLNLDETIADAVIDWLDKNDSGEYEYGFYSGLPMPYPCKNGKLDSIEELKRVNGVTQKAFTFLAPHLTVSPSDARININTASWELLMALSDEITTAIATDILEARSEMPFKNLNEVKDVIAGMDTAFWTDITAKITFGSSTFSVESTITAGEVTRTVKAVYKRLSSNRAKLLYYRVL